MFITTSRLLSQHSIQGSFSEMQYNTGEADGLCTELVWLHLMFSLYHKCKKPGTAKDLIIQEIQ